jgi:hypothetical protein
MYWTSFVVIRKLLHPSLSHTHTHIHTHTHKHKHTYTHTHHTHTHTHTHTYTHTHTHTHTYHITSHISHHTSHTYTHTHTKWVYHFVLTAAQRRNVDSTKRTRGLAMTSQHTWPSCDIFHVHFLRVVVSMFPLRGFIFFCVCVCVLSLPLSRMETYTLLHIYRTHSSLQHKGGMLTRQKHVKAMINDITTHMTVLRHHSRYLHLVCRIGVPYVLLWLVCA